MRILSLIPIVASVLAATPAAADLARISDRAAFVATVQGRELSRLGVSLSVGPDGTISGRALGRDVTGAWSWENGLFCRTLDAGNRQFPRNCQVVSADAANIRFHADEGTGEIADFRIR